MADARILIVDDHPLFREALRHALSAGKTHLEISEAGSLDTLIALLAKDDENPLRVCASSGRLTGTGCRPVARHRSGSRTELWCSG